MGIFLINNILLLICISLFAISFWISTTIIYLEKKATYECGLEPMGNSRMKFDIIYYIIGILYLIFDLEIIFLFPLASIIYILQSNITIFFMIIFLIIITIGFIYEWFQGALEILNIFFMAIPVIFFMIWFRAYRVRLRFDQLLIGGGNLG